MSGLCDICHRPTRGTFRTCWSCSRTSGQVSHPLVRLAVVSLYESRGQVWHLLRNYKDSPDPLARERLTVQVLGLLVRHVHEHGRCLAPQGWDLLAGVPSTHRPGPIHPLVAGLHRVGSVRDRVADLLVAGDIQLGHNQAHDRGYAVVRPGNERVLIVDDTFTSGARIQSAASALTLAGYDVVGGLVVGRVIDPGFDDRHAAIWSEATERGFDFSTCCRCDTAWRSTFD